MTDGLCAHNSDTLFLNFKAMNYMYCHPENVALRKGRPKLLNWQHLMITSDLTLSVKVNKLTNEADSLQLSSATKLLEVLTALKKMHTSQSLQVVTMGQWISFKWTTRRGNTQFQIMMETQRMIEQLIYAIKCSGITVIYNPRSLLLNQKINDVRNTSISNTYDSQNTQVQDMDEETYYLEASQQQQQQQQSQNQTQVEQEQPLFCPTDSRALLKPSRYANSEIQQHLQSEISVAPTASEYISVFSLAGSNVGARRKDMNLKNIEIRSLINKKVPLHLSVDTYSFAVSKRGDSQRQTTWNHVSLASDMCLSLIPSDHNGEPIIILSRGSTNLETFVPHPGYLSVYFSSEFLVMEQTGIGSRHQSRYIQIHMKHENIAITCEWLNHWQVASQDPTQEYEPYTEATTDMLCSKAMGSELSRRSRESRFWYRRTRAYVD